VAKKLYYKIGEACKMLGIQPYVLRYWETEFAPLSPTKSKSGQRVYSDQDLAVIRRIKELLYDEGYTIAGAKKQLEGNGASVLADFPEEAAPEAAAKEAAAAKPRRKKTTRKSKSARARKAASSPAEELAEAEERVDVAPPLATPESQEALQAALTEARALLEFLDARA
jgi:DNA-binding transcriptional MerR regulator